MLPLVTESDILILVASYMSKSKEDRIRRMKIQSQASKAILEPNSAANRPSMPFGLPGNMDDADVRTLYLLGEACARLVATPTPSCVASEKVAELEPENVKVLLALGWCHKRTGRIDRAIAALESALAADSEEPLIRYNLACYHSVAGDKRHALAYLEQALALDPNYRLLIEHEPDFDPLRGDAEFQAICDGSQTRG